jgi:hypothetical protein
MKPPSNSQICHHRISPLGQKEKSERAKKLGDNDISFEQAGLLKHGMPASGRSSTSTRSAEDPRSIIGLGERFAL